MRNECKIIAMSDIAAEEVRWLWYPYIPYGKVTIIQGDPGEGKTSFVLAMIALLTRGEPLPEEAAGGEPVNVIYQSAEDGLADTIKPRLERSGADCSKVLVIDESQKDLTLCDARLEQAILETGARLIVLDPMQAYLGDQVDMHRANEIRPMFKRLCRMAERTGCAVILIGHMNKAQGLKASYRGLGSIDFRAAARSVLLVGRMKDSPDIRVVAHDKSSLAPEGRSIAFALDAENGFQWKGFCDTTVNELLAGEGTVQTKTMRMEEALKTMLTKPVSVEEVFRRAKELGISERTVNIAKKNLGVGSVKSGNQWYWTAPGARM
ncbi:AAA family ATPase [Ethanoligenens harbinense]|uniref:AAA+ ATPase domain-containing protein n=1 Tax=Ethanoligenens harbinense (strain DSM 18485 / JCM 12961 / CGMCC 1.5033 / YUAN-3) TaxID=663278 RepID=E6U5Q9_ETHHY|nr:AAA family ATPase [Ethanoligenens harbinense]ADU26818.1 hypothetical protein Ethha_1275 [Ethanoligenens harbinense YUAN-3]AVQ95925.1 hypothetical protein CXQ68_06570 [Ethanoligenens harbinense YUAN-3]AYF38587.1 hypothetical protein CXP51_06440 [Ethanoligenens harbinense]AYF41333.1 hypothetical protein CN246_06575 [Ethanoligenens harbinense]QCN92166.1 hypothetical protein DRA42_06595 [Ethanoligenens harbinense]